MGRDREGQEIDLTVVTWTAAEFVGRGTIAGEDVACISAAVQLDFHLGYDHDDRDRADVVALCDHAGLELPAAYR